MSGKDKSIDLGDEKQVAERKKALISKEEQFEADLHYVLSEKIGRRLIWSMLEDGKIFTEPHVPGDPFSTAFNNGHASYARRVFAILNTKPFSKKYALMISENNAERDNDE